MKNIFLILLTAMCLFACTSTSKLFYENAILLKAPVKQIRYTTIPLDSLGNLRADSASFVINFNEKGERINQTRVVYPSKNIFRSEYDYFENGARRSETNFRNDTITSRVIFEKDKNEYFYNAKEYDKSGKQSYYGVIKFNKIFNPISLSRYKMDGSLVSRNEMKIKGRKMISGKLYDSTNKLINESYWSYNKNNELEKMNSKRVVKDSLINDEYKYSFENYDAKGNPQTYYLFRNGRKINVRRMISYDYFK